MKALFFIIHERMLLASGYKMRSQSQLGFFSIPPNVTEITTKTISCYLWGHTALSLILRHCNVF